MSKRILVVDDEATIRYLVTETLRDAGYEVLPVDDGQVALGIIDVYQPDGILLDIMMPKMDGAQMVRLLQASCRRAGTALPSICVMTAGYAASKIAQDLGLKHWIGKPFTLDGLRDKTAAMLADVPSDAPSDVLKST